MEKLTKRQAEIVKKMQDGWILLVGQSEDNGRIYQYVTNETESDYFNERVWNGLYKADMIYQQFEHPYHFVLTNKGERYK